jgi:Membrane magnesium transporter
MILNVTGIVLLLHAAYSCLHYRSLVGDIEDNIMPIPPLDVMAETAAGFLFLLIGQLMRSRQLVPVSITGGKRKSLAAPAYRSRDFDIYSNRAHVMKR